MNKRPILFVSDSISATSGLGRITRDLASRVHEHLGDIYRVGTAGYGGAGSRRFPWPDYHFHSVENWLLPELPLVAGDFAGDDGELTVLFVWDLSRLYWVGIPETCPIPFLRRWVEELRKSGKVKFHIYHAIDAEGPNGKLSARIADTMKGFDRVLDYSAFSSRITGNPDHLPHGIDSKVFYPRDRKEAREAFGKNGFQGLSDKSLLIGIVATNQARKNWQLGMETCKILQDRGHDVRVWCHTDVLDRHWSIGTLIADYGLQGRVAVTTQKFTDDQMCWLYSACDVTLGIAPEGFGFPIAESLACGTPCVCGSYGAQAEFAPKTMQVDPVGYFYEGAFCSKRPVHMAEKWAIRVEMVKGACVHLPESIDWNGPTLWPSWEKWFREEHD